MGDKIALHDQSTGLPEPSIRNTGWRMNVKRTPGPAICEAQQQERQDMTLLGL